MRKMFSVNLLEFVILTLVPEQKFAENFYKLISTKYKINFLNRLSSEK